MAEDRARSDPFDGLVRIGVDEISYKRGHRYLMVVVDHRTGRLVWAEAGHDRKTLEAFFDLLGEERCQKVRAVSADAANWIGDVVAERCPTAVLCIDPFHVAAWATDALDEVRRETWNEARKGGMIAKAGRWTRFALRRGLASWADDRAKTSHPSQAERIGSVRTVRTAVRTILRQKVVNAGQRW